MLSALVSIGFINFLQTAVFAVRIYSKWKYFSRTNEQGRGKRMFKRNGTW